jgi:glycosyltransferase involved in cell wall biosynthesis
MLSVIIATENDEEPLALTLSSLISAAADGTVREVMVVDANSSDGTLRVVDATGCSLTQACGSVGARNHIGAQSASRGEWLLFLRPGVILDPCWEAEVTAFVDRSARSGRGDVAAVFRHELGDLTVSARIRQAGQTFLSALTGVPAPSQGLLLSRRFYRALGGFASLDGLADVDFIRRIGRRRLVRLRSAAVVARRTDRHGPRLRLTRGLAALRLPIGLLRRLQG